MNATSARHRIDLLEAVKYDIRLHGERFILIEFAFSTLGATVMAVVEFLHAALGPLPVTEGIWFMGVALNCLAVVILALQARRLGTETLCTEQRLHWFAAQLIAMLLIPAAVLLATLAQWRSGDFRSNAAV